MGMSTHVVGIKPPNEYWKKMKAAWDACMEADVIPPQEVEEFFDGEPPDEKGVVVDLGEFKEKYKGEAEEGYEININNLPDGVEIIRFYNSW